MAMNKNNVHTAITAILIIILGYMNLYQYNPGCFVTTQIESSQSVMQSDITTNNSTSSSLSSSVTKEKVEYVPASTEDYIMTHTKELGYDGGMWAVGCTIYKSPENSTEEVYNNLHALQKDLEAYNEAIKNFNATKTKDILEKIRHGSNSGESQGDICKATRPHPDGIQALFPSKQLSLTYNGYVEPLLTPMRSPKFCKNPNKYVLDIDYLVHDFESMCLKLKPSSQIVLIDMGASLAFHHDSDSQPIMTLMKNFEKHGLFFDHIFAFEVTEQNPTKVYRDLLPEKYLSSYHWINTGVSADKSDKMNPLYSIISKFHEDDLIIVKLDIDTPEIEQPLFDLLVEDDSVNKLVDQFYFEHHIRLYDMLRYWWISFEGGDIWEVKDVKESLDAMSALRKKGVASHYWV